MRKKAIDQEDLVVETASSHWNLSNKISWPYGRCGLKGQQKPPHFSARGRQIEAWNKLRD